MTAAVTTSLPVGTEVGARRWPDSHGHPDGWLPPHKGVVLAINDPRAWTGTVAFSGAPSQAEVDRHIEWMTSSLPEGAAALSVPVLWSFGRVYFEPADRLQPYAKDFSDWESARVSARGRTDGDCGPSALIAEGHAVEAC